MARRRVQDGQAQGELARTGESHDTASGAAYESNGVEASRALHAQSKAAADALPVRLYVAENTEENRAEVARRLPVVSQQPASVTNVHSTPLETISVTWGEELFTPVQYCSFRVGPFSASSTLRAGESREQAGDRLMRELEKIAAKERDNKIRVFKDALEKVIPKKGSAS